MKKQIIFGLPKGSLNNRDRGNTCQLLKDAGYEIVGYEPGNEQPSKLVVLNDEGIKPVLVRPQSAPKELYDGIIDIAVSGTDWGREWQIAGYDVEKLADLDYGSAGIIFASNRDINEILAQDSIRCCSEYPNIARYSLEQITRRQPSLEIRGLRIEADQGIVVCFSDGLTEAYVQKGLADLIVECTQSGSSLKEYGLEQQMLLMYTGAALYANPALDGWKQEKAKGIKEMLMGAVKARQYDLLVFNISNEYTDAVLNYLEGEQLFADEPTVNPGIRWDEVTVMVPKKSYPETTSNLQRLGAKSIIRLEPKQII